MPDVKMQDMKLMDQMTEHKIAGHINDGHKIVRQKIQY